MGAIGQHEGVTGWVAELDADDLPRSAVLRLDDGLEGGFSPDGGRLWLRGRKLNHAVLSLPFLNLYRVDGEDPDRLFPLDSELPSRRIPEDLRWTPIVDSIIPRPALAFFSPDEVSEKAPVRIVRGGAGKSPNLLRLGRDAWWAFVVGAPRVRLSGLTFAASADQVVVRVRVLPPLRAEGWVEEEGIAIPVGHCLAPAIAPRVLRKTLKLVSGEVALISPDGMIERIAAENFVPATRTAVRQMMSSS